MTRYGQTRPATGRSPGAVSREAVGHTSPAWCSGSPPPAVQIDYAAHVLEKDPDPNGTRGARLAHLAYAWTYRVIAAAFAACALLLVAFAGLEVFHGLSAERAALQVRFSSVLEAIGMLTIAVAALELSQTVWEEEVQRKALMSAPTRVRRFISRFMVVVVVALSIEALTAAFRFVHEDPGELMQAAAIAFGAAALLVAWGAFVRLNLAAEALEPEGMTQAKREDAKLDEKKAEADD